MYLKRCLLYLNKHFWYFVNGTLFRWPVCPATKMEVTWEALKGPLPTHTPSTHAWPCPLHQAIPSCSLSLAPWFCTSHQIYPNLIFLIYETEVTIVSARQASCEHEKRKYTGKRCQMWRYRQGLVTVLATQPPNSEAFLPVASFSYWRRAFPPLVPHCLWLTLSGNSYAA